MEQHPLLQTKLYIPPIRRELVSRPRLIQRLSAGLNGCLTLVSAPAGFGKTTLVSEWVHKVRAHGDAPPHVAWLSLDEGDNDPSRFLAYLIVALQTIEANLGKGALSALQSPQPPPAGDVLTGLINEIAAVPKSIVLVLDDHQTIESSLVDKSLAFLLERLPPQMHLVIATREDPHLPLARLRARGQLTELRASDLRFTSSEAAEFLNQAMGLDLSAKDIAALDRRTEGWITGLQLAAISMQARQDATSFVESFTGSHRYVLDYLIEEVLDQQPERIQTFLLQTAILNRLTGSLCDFLTENNIGQATLEALERGNLFIVPLDEERRWYRYHHLFADLLRQRLRQQHADWIPRLHERASAWYEQNGFLDEAVEHALQAEDFERVASLIEGDVDALWQRGEQIKLRRWLDGLSVEVVFSRPHLCILCAWDQFTSGQQDAAERSLQAAEQALKTAAGKSEGSALPDRGRQPGLDRRKIQGRVAAVRAFLAFYRGDAQATREYARRALDLLAEEDMTWRSTATVALGDAYAFVGDLGGASRVRYEAVQAARAAGNVYMVLIASMKLASNLRAQGQLERVVDICQQQQQMANESGLSQAVVVGWLLAVWGEVLAEQNDLDAAIEKARKGTEMTAKGRDLAALGWSYLCLVRVLFSRRDLIGAEAAIKRMIGIAGEHHVPPWMWNRMAAWQARIWLAQGRLDDASHWAEGCGLDVAGDSPYLRQEEHVAWARILIAQGQLEEAVELIRRLLGAAESRGHISGAIELSNLQALAFQTAGDLDQAMAALERALTLAEPGGFIRLFLDEGRPMARLLYEAASRGIAPEYVSRLLAAFSVAETKESEPTKPQEASEVDLIEPLSERELEVLQLIAEGLTNAEIASRFFLSVNTVKAHTRNIYGKLAVHNRTQAVTTARALGILPST